MTPTEARQHIERIVESVSSFPVHVEADPTLRTLATVTMARGPLPAHIIRFNPAVGPSDYLIAYQCGFVVRAYSVPPQDRFDVVAAYRGRKEAERLVGDHFRKVGQSLPGSARGSIAEQMYSGLILQLRSVPVGLRIDDWVRQDYPALKEQQERSIRRQLDDNVKGLSPEVVRMAPPPILSANAKMNAAFAAYWARAWSEPTLLTPYKATGYAAGGEDLLRLWDEIPSDPADDRRLITEWADRLGLAGWFEFGAKS